MRHSMQLKRIEDEIMIMYLPAKATNEGTQNSRKLYKIDEVRLSRLSQMEI